MLHLNLHPFPELFTKRLHLRELQSGDAAQVFFLRSDPAVNRYIHRTRARIMADAEAHIERIHRNTRNNESVYWAISLKNDPQLIGSICYWNIVPEKDKAEIGYELHPSYQKRGIMQEALNAVLDYGHDVLKIKRIEAWTSIRNEASTRMLEKNNFKRDLQQESGLNREEEGEDAVIYVL